MRYLIITIISAAGAYNLYVGAERSGMDRNLAIGIALLVLAVVWIAAGVMDSFADAVGYLRALKDMRSRENFEATERHKWAQTDRTRGIH